MDTARGFSRKRLRGHRNGLALSRAEVGERIGRTEAAVKSYEDGLTQPPTSVLASLAAVFETTVDDLYERHDDPVQDYVDAVASHCRPLTDSELDAAAVILRRINQRSLRGVTSAGSVPT